MYQNSSQHSTSHAFKGNMSINDFIRYSQDNSYGDDTDIYYNHSTRNSRNQDNSNSNSNRISLSNATVDEIIDMYKHDSELLKHLLVAKAEEDKKRAAEELRKAEEARLQANFIDLQLDQSRRRSSSLLLDDTNSSIGVPSSIADDWLLSSNHHHPQSNNSLDATSSSSNLLTLPAYSNSLSDLATLSASPLLHKQEQQRQLSLESTTAYSPYTLFDVPFSELNLSGPSSPEPTTTTSSSNNNNNNRNSNGYIYNNPSATLSSSSLLMVEKIRLTDDPPPLTAVDCNATEISSTPPPPPMIVGSNAPPFPPASSSISYLSTQQQYQMENVTSSRPPPPTPPTSYTNNNTFKNSNPNATSTAAVNSNNVLTHLFPPSSTSPSLLSSGTIAQQQQQQQQPKASCKRTFSRTRSTRKPSIKVMAKKNRSSRILPASNEEISFSQASTDTRTDPLNSGCKSDENNGSNSTHGKDADIPIEVNSDNSQRESITEKGYQSERKLKITAKETGKGEVVARDKMKETTTASAATGESRVLNHDKVIEALRAKLKRSSGGAINTGGGSQFSESTTTLDAATQQQKALLKKKREEEQAKAFMMSMSPSGILLLDLKNPKKTFPVRPARRAPSVVRKPNSFISAHKSTSPQSRSNETSS